MDYKLTYQSWLNDPFIDEADKHEFAALTDECDIEDRFYRSLEFGTAGLRGVIGLGTNRMNRYIVMQATQGYANYLLSIPGAAERGIAIAYDSRNKSSEFALQAALVLCANAIRVHLFDTMHSVPQLSFAIGYYGCVGGIVITASHNPKQYNGYKVYGENGAQIPPHIADAVTAQIDSVSNYSLIKHMSKEVAITTGYLTMIGNAVDRAYFAYVKEQSLHPQLVRSLPDFKVVYTPLYGTGRIPVVHVLEELGVANIYVVPEQAMPDPEFPTVQAPNPESPDAFDLGIVLADQVGADLILATDPDTDRLGVAVREASGTFSILTGNQIGCLLMHYILSRKAVLGLPKDAFVVKSIVSTNMANEIANDFHVRIDEVLTGFRYVGELVATSVDNKQGSFLFGFEESYGYLAGTKVRDKDAICAAMLLTEAAAYYASRSMTLRDGLVELFDKYGYYTEVVRSYTLQGKEGLAKIQAAMTGLRAKCPTEFAGYQVKAVRDYQSAQRTSVLTKEQTPIPLPSSNVLYFEMQDGSWICARPSGTEPKLKIYANGYAGAFDSARLKLNAMIDALENTLNRWLNA